MNKDIENWLHDHCKEAYEYQLGRTDELRSRFSFLAGLLVLLGSGMAYYATNFVYAWNCHEILFFYVPVGAGIVLLGVAVSRILYALTATYKYSYLEKPDRIVRYCEELETAMAKRPQDQRENTLPIVMRASMYRFAQGATHNLKINRKRTEHTIAAQKLAVIAFICLILATPRFAYVKYSEQQSERKKETSQTTTQQK